MLNIIFLVMAYLMGSVSFAVLMSKAFGLADPRTYGSGNPGATNVLRSGKKAAAVLTLLGDGAKGWLAVVLAQHFVPHEGSHLTLVAFVALAVFLGHLFPVFLHFKGGKGVATALGVFLAFNVLLGLAVLATWIFVALVFRYSSLAALIAAVSAPVYGLVMLSNEYLLASGVMSLMLIWRHKDNIRSLLAGTESKIGSKKSEDQPADNQPE